MEEIFSFISDCGLARGKMHAEVKVFADRVEIKRDTKWKVAKQTTIYFDSVTAISHKMSKGLLQSEQWITFAVPGVRQDMVVAVEPGTYVTNSQIAPFDDEYSIIFRKDNAQAEKYIRRIQEIYQEFKNNHTPSAVNNVVQGESAIEKLKKLKEIYDLNIITEEEYEVASASIMFMTKPEYRGAKDFLLKGKVRCGNCHRSLAYTDGGIHPKVYCPHKAQAGRYSHCSEDAYPVSVIEGHIWYSLKRILRILDSVQRESEEKYTDNSFTGKRQQRVLESELKKLKNERIHQYEAYAEGVLSREKYITVKKQLTEKIEKIQSEQKALASVIIEEERYRSRIRTAVQRLEVQIERGKLTKEIIDTMIDTVYVYDKKRIEVILRFDDVLQKVISEYMEGAKGA